MVYLHVQGHGDSSDEKGLRLFSYKIEFKAGEFTKKTADQIIKKIDKPEEEQEDQGQKEKESQKEESQKEEGQERKEKKNEVPKEV